MRIKPQFSVAKFNIFGMESNEIYETYQRIKCTVEFGELHAILCFGAWST